MKPDYEAQYHLLEENHWWFLGRRHVVRALVLRANPSRDARILEIGCSGGPLIQQLHSDGFTQVTGIDISPEAIQLCKKRHLHDTYLMDAQQPSFPAERFDIVTASDVLEHLSDAPRSVREWHRLLAPNGLLIVYVPAFMLLWSEHDVANNHFKRFRRSELERLLTETGFIVERSSYWNFCLFFPIAGLRLLKRLLRRRAVVSRGDLFPIPALLNRALAALLRVENRCLLRGLNFPIGVSVMVVGRKAPKAPERPSEAAK